MMTSQVLLANAARQNHLCLRFFYDIYDSPYPATFRRVPDEPKEALGPAEPPTPPLSPGGETAPPSAPTIHITVHSELQPGSTGIVHIGAMAVDPSGPTAKVAVKLAFSRDEKSRLMEEHRIYSHLRSRGVQGIPCVIGLFVDEEPLLGAEGPHALVMTYAGVSLFRSYALASDSAKQVLSFTSLIDSNGNCRDSLLATLESIHRANVLHGDIRLPNLCVTPLGEAFVVDFGHAIESRSRKEKAQEIRQLSYILGMDSPTKPAAKAIEKPVLRRSARIKELERKAKVEPKIEQVKRGKSTRRR
jgi:tRNA A-37 threonylcarbamoyl transferase component Bud32